MILCMNRSWLVGSILQTITSWYMLTIIIIIIVNNNIIIVNNNISIIVNNNISFIVNNNNNIIIIIIILAKWCMLTIRTPERWKTYYEILAYTSGLLCEEIFIIYASTKLMIICLKGKECYLLLALRLCWLWHR